MNHRTTQCKALALAIGLALAAPLAQADHNSIWGDGWATDAQGRHAAAVDRIEELGPGTDDSQAGERSIKVQGTPRAQGDLTATAGSQAERADPPDTAASRPIEAPDAARHEREQLRQSEDEDEDGGEALRRADRVEQRYGTGYEYRMQRHERGLRPERPERPAVAERPQRPEPAERPQRPQGPERIQGR